MKNLRNFPVRVFFNADEFLEIEKSAKKLDVSNSKFCRDASMASIRNSSSIVRIKRSPVMTPKRCINFPTKPRTMRVFQ